MANFNQNILELQSLNSQASRLRINRASPSKALVCGAGGFIGSHLVKRLKSEGYWVRGVDLKKPEFSPSLADEFIVGDLRDAHLCKNIITPDLHEVYQLAADMGGAGYVFVGTNDADILYNSAMINLNVAKVCAVQQVRKVFFSSSACVYAEHHQQDPNQPNCSEESAYPANPDSNYGWEKLFSERLYLAFAENADLDVKVARFHNVFGPDGAWQGGREKAPAALCRKVAEAKDGDAIEVWGDGKQTRSFLYIDECLEGIRRLMQSSFSGPVNIGADQMISIENLTRLIIAISGKKLNIRFVPGPQGVRGRTSDNRLIKEKLVWQPSQPLAEGLSKTYEWICEQVGETVRTEIVA